MSHIRLENVFAALIDNGTLDRQIAIEKYFSLNRHYTVTKPSFHAIRYNIIVIVLFIIL